MDAPTQDEINRFDGLYERLRGQVEHENGLYNQRISWLITMQAFLYATIGLSMQARLQPAAGQWMVQIDGFTALVCLLGAMVALVSNRLLDNARKALAHLRQTWLDESARMPAALLRFYPHVSGGDGKPLRASFLSSGNLPKFFALSWVAVAAVLLARPAADIVAAVAGMLHAPQS